MKKLFVSPIVFFLINVILFIPFLFICVDWNGFAIDEAFTTMGARRILEGQLPYRDFFLLWTPGTLFLVALLGANFWMAKFFALLNCAAINFFGFLFCKWKEASRIDLIFVSATLVMWSFTHWNLPYSSWTSTLFLMAAITVREQRVFCIGILLALAFWMKQNIGCFSFLGVCIYYLIQFNLKAILRLSLTFFLVLLIGAVPFIFSHAFFDFIQQVFIFPFVYKNTMSLPFSLENFKPIFYPIIVLVLFSLPLGVWEALRKRDKEILWVTCLSAGPVLQVYPRFDSQHFLFAVPVSILIFFLFFRSRGWISYFRYFLSLLLLCGFMEFVNSASILMQPTSVLHGIAARGENAKKNEEIIGLLSYLKEIAGLNKEDSLLVLPHETIIYSLGGYRNVLPLDHFLPGYSRFFQITDQEIIKQYVEKGGKYIVLGNERLVQKANPDLYRYLMSHAWLIKRFPLYFSLWQVDEFGFERP